MKINLYTVLLLSVIALSWTDSYTDQEQEIGKLFDGVAVPHLGPEMSLFEAF